MFLENNMNYKYVILDFGKVLAGPATGHWFITPKFIEVIDMDLIDKRKLDRAISKYGKVKSRQITTEKEEYEMFYEFYDLILREINYPYYSSELIDLLAYNFAYENDKYRFYKNIEKELEHLKDKYKLILLTDNWPSVSRILANKNLTKYFDRIYISSCYGVEKKDGLFFDYPIKEFNIKENEALFIDDSEDNLKIAKGKGLDVMLMDRDNEINESSYQKIDNLLVL